MIGFDRPLKPRWIHETLLLWRACTPVNDFYSGFNEIVHELDGSEGKRKVRTVLFRYFFDFDGHSFKEVTTKASLLSSLAHKASINDLEPAYLVTIIDRSSFVQESLTHMMRLFPFGSTIMSKQLIDQMIKLHGERLVVIRSCYSFLNTLVNFGVLSKVGTNYQWTQKLRCTQVGLAYALVLFMTNNGLLEVEVKELGQNLRFSLIDISNIEDCAKRYNGVLWTYIRRPQTAKIMLHQDVKEKVAFV